MDEQRPEYPAPSEARSVVVFGGTFDPPHRGHIELPLAARDAAGADWLLYVPAGRSPLKRSNPTASDADRVAMLDAALRHADRVSVSTVELHRDAEPGGEQRPPSYTVDTLERLRSLAPASTKLRLLIGADQAADFHRWREPGRIMELADPLVMLRLPHENPEAFLNALCPHWAPGEIERWRRRIVDVPLIDVNATRIRELLEAGERDHPELKRDLPAPVLALIRERNLYR